MTTKRLSGGVGELTSGSYHQRSWKRSLGFHDRLAHIITIWTRLSQNLHPWHCDEPVHPSWSVNAFFLSSRKWLSDAYRNLAGMALRKSPIQAVGKSVLAKIGNDSVIDLISGNVGYFKSVSTDIVTLNSRKLGSTYGTRGWLLR
jgi:hypothetical protein